MKATGPTTPVLATERPPRLALRFAVYSGLALLVAGLGLLWVLTRDVESRAERRAEEQTQLVAKEVLREELRLSDFTRPLDARRQHELEKFFATEAIGSGVVGATLFSRYGVITYSTDESLIGKRQPSGGLRTALAGSPHREKTTSSGRKVLRTFVPVRWEVDGAPIGALALSQDYRAIDLQIQEALTHSAVILGLALIALWVSLIPILRRTTAQLKARNRQLVTQARELEEALQERRRAEETVVQLAAIVESSDDAILGVATSGEIQSWNAGAERLFGYDAEEMIGQPVAVLVPDERMQELKSVARRIDAGEGVEEHQTRGRRKDGTEVDVSLTVSPIRDSLHRVTGAAVIARDTTQAKRQERQLQSLLAKERRARAEAEAAQRTLAEQNERLREFDRLKDEFISLVSHELRTPLTSIRGYLELLLDGGAGELAEDQRRFLVVVDRNSKRLLHLVGDLLFLAQVEAGKLALDLSEVEIDHVVTESVEAAKPIADDKGIALRASIEPTPSTVGDRGRLGQVLDNLVSNALKFTPPGGSVDVRVASQGREAVIEIVDTGIGIAPSDQAQLFDRFFRSSEATQRAIPGTGLGLTIVKTIVERHGGSIEVESAAGEGTTMRVRLPLSRSRALAEGVAA